MTDFILTDHKLSIALYQLPMDLGPAAADTSERAENMTGLFRP